MKRYFVYVIKSETHESRYIGNTDNVEKRLKGHNAGYCRYTKGRRPWILLRVEEFETRGEAMKREKFLKTGQGRKDLDELFKDK